MALNRICFLALIGAVGANAVCSDGNCASAEDMDESSGVSLLQTSMVASIQAHQVDPTQQAQRQEQQVEAVVKAAAHAAELAREVEVVVEAAVQAEQAERVQAAAQEAVAPPIQTHTPAYPAMWLGRHCVALLALAGAITTCYLNASAMDCISISTGRKMLDVIALGTCIALVVLVSMDFLKEPSAWFSWHPVLMTLGFGFLMPLGRWSYKADSKDGPEKAVRRRVHGAMMASATIIALVGYLAIFMAHLPKKSFFGYNFETHQWNPDGKRIAHSILGYVVIFAAVLQACMGIAKYANLNNGVKTMTFHGLLGKVIIFGGAINMLLAILLWGYTTIQKIRLIALLACTLVFATVLPLPSEFVNQFGCPGCLAEGTES